MGGISIEAIFYPCKTRGLATPSKKQGLTKRAGFRYSNKNVFGRQAVRRRFAKQISKCEEKERASHTVRGQTCPDRELLAGGKQRRGDCALALEQQAEPPSGPVGCAGIDAVIPSGRSPIGCLGRRRRAAGLARQQEWYREAFVLRLLAQRPGDGAFCLSFAPKFKHAVFRRGENCREKLLFIPIKVSTEQIVARASAANYSVRLHKNTR